MNMTQDQIPCINCLTLATCKAYIKTLKIPKSNNQEDHELMLTRYTITKCTTSLKYVYCIPQEFDRGNGPEVLMTYDPRKLKIIKDYLLKPYSLNPT